MNSIRNATLLVVFLGIIMGMTLPAFAGGGSAGIDCCKITNPGGGYLAMKGTLAVWFDKAFGTVDATLRLERSGQQRFYRIRIIQDISADSDIDIFCKLFNWSENCAIDPVKTKELVKEILEDFFGLDRGLPADDPAADLFVTSTSISDTDPDPGEEGFRQIPYAGLTFMSIADVTVYVSKF